jgi:uncharacterized protein (TIGR03084 family)
VTQVARRRQPAGTLEHDGAMHAAEDSLDELRTDLLAEQGALDLIVAGLTPEQWALPTPSPGWNVADQIGHLTYFDGTAAEAIEDPEAFATGVGALLAAAGEGVDGADRFTLGTFRTWTAEQQLAAWRQNRLLLAEAATRLTATTRVAWYGPSMGAKSFLTARLMEVWAHGNDVADALGATRPATDRLRHIAQLGYITRGWSYAVRGQVAPEGEIRLVLTSPSGGTWTWGPGGAAETVSGSAEDFCLVVTQRRHLDDTELSTGELGRHWLVRAQAFAGGPTEGPAPNRR